MKPNVYSILEGIFAADRELSSLMVTPSGAAEQSRLSFRELTERNIIGFDMEKVQDMPEDVPCRLIAEMDEGTLSLSFLCHYSQWMLGLYQQRMLEIARRIWDAVDGRAGADGQVLYVTDCSAQALSDDLGMYSISLDTNEPVNPERHENPFRDYEKIYRRVAEEMVRQEAVADFLGTGDIGACLQKESLSFTDAVRKPEDGINRINAVMNYSVGDLSFQVTAVRWKTGRDAEDAEQLDLVREGITQALTSIPGFSVPNWNDQADLGGIVRVVFGSFDLAYDPDTFGGAAKPYQNRPNFFVSAETWSSLLDMEVDPEAPVFDFSVDLINMPYRIFYVHEEEQDVMKVLKRLELCSYQEPDEPTAEFVIRHGASEASVTMSEEDQSLQNALGAFYMLDSRIRTYVGRNGLYGEIRLARAENAGLLIESRDGSFSHRMLEGQDRPALQCATLFGGLQMMRPYSENFLEQARLEYMELDEKVEAAERGDTSAMDALGLLYLNGDDETEPDPEKAFYWFHKLAEAGSSKGMFNTGLLYAKGFGVERDFQAASEWMQKAADHGDDDGRTLAEKYRAMAEDMVRAEKGDHAAQAELALSYMELGNSLDQADGETDYAESLKWALEAAEADCAKAFWALGLACEHGRGVRQDTQKAADLYRIGAEKGDAACQNSIGIMYMRGDPVEQDQEAAYRWIRKSAEQGYGLGMKNLGQCYQFGNGCQESMARAIQWYEKYLEVCDDPEMQQKVEGFKHLQSVLGDEDELKNEDGDAWEQPEGYMDAMQAFSEADEYEQELYANGFLPEFPAPSDDGIMGKEQYPRLMRKAADGDERAQRIAKTLGWLE